jgi:cytochrome c553
MTTGRKIGLLLLSLLVLITAGAVTVRLRGFRASSQPSPVETSVARAIRNFSIPNSESHKKNPHPGDELARQERQELYLTRCASCHGTDGRGTTPIGANVSARS